MIKIERKEGWILNPNDKLVNAILKRCEKNDGLCPCHHDTPNYEGNGLHCPCTDYTVQGECACGLYMRDKRVEIQFDEKLMGRFNKYLDDKGEYHFENASDEDINLFCEIYDIERRVYDLMVAMETKDGSENYKRDMIAKKGRIYLWGTYLRTLLFLLRHEIKNKWRYLKHPSFKKKLFG